MGEPAPDALGVARGAVEWVLYGDPPAPCPEFPATLADAGDGCGREFADDGGPERADDEVGDRAAIRHGDPGRDDDVIGQGVERAKGR